MEKLDEFSPTIPMKTYRTSLSILLLVGDNLERLDELDDIPAPACSRLLYDLVRMQLQPFIFSPENSVRVLEVLVKRGADVEFHRPSDPHQRTPLYHAVTNKRLSQAVFLLENGASVHRLFVDLAVNLKYGNEGFDPNPPLETSYLTLAVESGSLEMVELLLKYGADLNHALNCGCLFLSVRDRDIQMLKLLVTKLATVKCTQFHREPWGKNSAYVRDNIFLSDIIFLEASRLEDLIRFRLTHNTLEVGHFEGFAVRQDYLDCLKIIISKGAPTPSPAAIRGALRFGLFLTVCQVYNICFVSGVPVGFPDAFPVDDQSDLPHLVRSGPEVLAKMLQIVPLNVRISETFQRGLCQRIGMEWKGDGPVRKLKTVCILQIRKSLQSGGKCNDFTDLVLKLELPDMLRDMISMKSLTDFLDSELSAAKKQLFARAVHR